MRTVLLATLCMAHKTDNMLHIMTTSKDHMLRETCCLVYDAIVIKLIIIIVLIAGVWCPGFQTRSHGKEHGNNGSHI